VLSTFSQEVFFSSSFLLVSVVSAISTGIIAPIVFYLFNRLRSLFLRGAGKPKAEQL
jgi:hypothetical protein